MKTFEVIVMIGIPGSGKTTFCKSRFFPGKVYISLDQLRSRRVEDELYSFCLRNRISCVIDNTNVNAAERRRYIPRARAAGARIVGYCFPLDYEACMERNAKRQGRARVPEIGMRERSRSYRAPSFAEGFDALHGVRISGSDFEEEVWYEEERTR